MHRTVTAVTQDGKPLSEVGLIEAHTGEGILHRAFSVFVFSPDRNKLMLQKRAEKKPTFGGLWGNTCCSHQFPGEEDTAAGMRRLREEMGFSVPVVKGSAFVYRAMDPRGNGFLEHEHDTVLIGTATEDVPVVLNPHEASDWKWMDMVALKKELESHADLYVPWLSIALKTFS